MTFGGPSQCCVTRGTNFSPSSSSFWLVAHFQKKRSAWNSLPRRTSFWLRVSCLSCNPKGVNSLPTKYLLARTTYVRFQSFPIILSIPHFACRLLLGQPSHRSVLIGSCFALGYEILGMCELMVKPRVSMLLSQSVLLMGARIDFAPTFPSRKRT